MKRSTEGDLAAVTPHHEDRAADRPKKRAKVDPVKKANALQPAVFERLYLDEAWLTYEVQRDDQTHRFDIVHYTATSLSKHDLDACFRLIKTTSHPDYKASSIGWRPVHKRREMKDTLMHYLVVRRKQAGIEEGGTAPTIVEGFLSFMLTEDSRPCVPVVYIYEVHLAESARSLGLGARLLDISESLALKVGVTKVMLTCFVSNVNATQFYQRLGFSIDPVSPEDRQTRNKLIKADYMIMSKTVIPG